MKGATMPQVFLSHSSKDDAIIDRLHDELERLTGAEVWVDHRDNTPDTASWQEAIDRNLRDAPFCLVAVSRTSVESTEVTVEWRGAMLYGHPVLVAILDDVPLEAISSRLRIIPAVNLHADWNGGIAKLAAAIKGKGAGADGPAFTAFAISARPTLDRKYTQIPLSGRDRELKEAAVKLAVGPVALLGVGGVGKSRLAAELLFTLEGVNGAIWHRADTSSRADQADELLRDHFGIEDVTTPRPALLKLLRSHSRLIVIDNAEDVPPADNTRRAEYVTLINELLAAGARVLLTSRVEWPELDPCALIPLHDPELDAAAQIVRDMMAVYDVSPEPHPLTPSPAFLGDGEGEPEAAYAIAKAARRHPRLIEAAVKRLKKFPLEKTLKELEELKGKTFEDAIQEMIGRSIAQMTAERDGAEAAAALRRLCACKGGFTYAAAEAITQMDTDPLDAALVTLQSWNFVRFDGQTRYTVDPLVLATQSVDDDARRAHLDFYNALADAHHARQDYAGLDVESDNLNAAFDGFIGSDPEAAYWLASACFNFLLNRGRVPQYVRWMETAAAAVAGGEDESLKAAVQNSLGMAYGNLSQQTEPEINLGKAIKGLEDALRFCRPEAAPLDYAAIQNNLGNAYTDVATLNEPEVNLHKAIAAYEAALRYATPEAAPLDYAMTQNNLGNAYSQMAVLIEPESHLGKAITAYVAALRYHTPEMVPLAYAMTQTNLGSAYVQLAALTEPEINLGKAIAAFEAALLYRTPEAAPLDYAMTQNNLGIALEEQGDLARACVCWRAGEPILRQMGYVRDADRVRGWIEESCGG